MRRIQRAYKTELDPTLAQRERFLQHAGASRYVYNWALARKQEAYKETGTSPKAMSGLNRELKRLKQTECPWMYEVCNAALQNAIRNADRAYDNFFRRVREGKRGRSVGFPRFKSRKRGIGSFKVNGGVSLTDRAVKLPLIGWVKVKERGYLPAGIGYDPEAPARMTSATVSERAGRWYVSIQVEEDIEEVQGQGEEVAVHLGVRRLATLSDGVVFENPKALERHLKRLARAQRSLSRKQKGSHNREKQRMRVARVHQHISNIRTHVIHETTTVIAKRYGRIIVQDFGVADMLEDADSHRLARFISDAAMGEFRRQLTYKADWNGVELVLVERGEPVSKKCSACGVVKGYFPLGQQVFTCDACGWEENRDDNAARNLLAAGKQPDALNASGPPVSPGLAGQGGLKEEPSQPWDVTQTSQAWPQDGV